MTPRRQASIIGVATLLLYGFGLSWAPVHLHFDEIRFAEQARSIAAHGVDVNGRFLPLYFQMDARVWFHPIGVYLPAIAFKLFAVSTAALRAPTAMIGALNVVLLYFLARRFFRNDRVAVVAALLLALTPAHFIHSRMAVDYLFPAPFVLAWCLLLSRALETRSHAWLFAATSVLAAGCYSYIAAVALMPLLLVTTVVLLWIEGWGWKGSALAAAGFAWVVIPGVWFMATHPEMLASTLGRYGVSATQLDAFQRVREMLTPWSISDRANLYSTFFAPGYLFVTGGNSFVGSTRAAGVFLAATLPLMLIGLRAAVLAYSPANVMMLAGLLLPPLAACVVIEPFAVGRAITMVPFAILLAASGAWELTRLAPHRALNSLLILASGGAAALALTYLTYRITQGEVSRGGLLLLVAAAAVAGLALMMRRTRTMAPLAGALLALCVLQFGVFTRDYFGDYAVRAAFWFNGNLEGTVSRLVREIDQSGDRSRAVLLDQDVNSIEWYWRFHLAAMGRSDLANNARLVSPDQIRSEPLRAGALLVLPAIDMPLRDAAASRGMTPVATIMDPGEQPSYVIVAMP